MRHAFLLSTVLTLVSMPWAHLVPNSFKLSKAGPYHNGDTITLTYGIDVTHGGVNVDFSSDGGNTWTTIKANLPAGSKGNSSYKWPVTQSATQQGKLRICQMGGSTPCTNANKTDNPSGGPNYWLISPVFTIDAATSLEPRLSETAPSFSQNSQGLVELAFTMASEGPVRLDAYDASGRIVAALFEGRYAAGSHRLSLFAETLRAHPEWILRLNTAGRIQTLR